MEANSLLAPAKPRLLPGAMPNGQDFDAFQTWSDAIEDAIIAAQNLAYFQTTAADVTAARMWMTREVAHPLGNEDCKPLGRRRIIQVDLLHDSLKRFAGTH